jgi:DNA helicase II / ATP-dependent DNA helicase PcrA
MNFDPDQEKVVSHLKGPMLVVAGAGSGKTATIIGRAAQMIQSNGIPGKFHLMLTFSRKAADEMRERLKKTVEEYKLDGMVIGTFHSFGYRLIREQPELCGRKSGLTILDEKDVMRLLKEIAQTCNVESEEEDGKKLLRNLYSIYSYACNEMLLVGESKFASQIDQLLEYKGVFKAHQKSLFFELFNKYEQKKIQANVVDFDDLLVLPVLGLKNGSGMWRDSVANRFPYITVDEGQDTNRAQFELMSLIGHHGNVVLVGDDDQSIYSWRGAKPSNMMEFRQKLGAKLVYLERNYRSTTAIIESASSHVSNNKKRFPKTSYAVKQGGSPISLNCRFSSDEARHEIVASIEAHLSNGGLAKDVAILYRVNRLARLLEYEFIARGIPYQIVGGMNFEQRKEIRYALAIARLVTNKNDESALATVCELTEGVGPSSLKKLSAAAQRDRLGLLECVGSLPAKARQALERVSGTVCFLRDIGGPNSMVDQIVAESGLNLMGQFEKKEKKESILTRYRNLMMLKDLIAKWTSTCEQGGEWDVIFEKIVGSASSEDKDEADVVTLSTLHRAKGLEWSKVHIFGYSEGILPLIKQDGNSDLADEEGDEDIFDDEEERRLSYVGITRAKAECSIWHCESYNYGYEVKNYGLSRFAREINVELCSKPKAIAHW